MAMGKVKLVLMICSCVSAALGFILLIVAIVNLAYIPSDFAHAHGSKKEKDVCSPSKNDTEETCQPVIAEDAVRKEYPRYYIPDTCPGALSELRFRCFGASFSTYGTNYYDTLCSCKNARLGICAYLMLCGLIQMGAAAFLLFTVLKKPQMPIKKKWFLFLIIHIVVWVIVFIALILGWVFNIADNEAVFWAKKTLALGVPGFGVKKRKSRSSRAIAGSGIGGIAGLTLPSNPDDNSPGSAYTGFCWFDMMFCVACIILFILFKFVKSLQKCNEAEDSGGVAPQQAPEAEAKSKSQVSPTAQPSETKPSVSPSGTAAGKPDESKGKPEAKDSKASTANPKPTSSKTPSKGNLAGGTRKSQKDVAGGGAAKERPSQRDIAGPATAAGASEKKK